MASLDLLVSASAYGEGFPNVVGEAMATAVPCVVTDVGDSAFLVGDNRCVVAPKDPDALSAAIASVLDLDENARTSISRQARDRVIRNFSTRKMTARYAAVYESVLKGWDVHGPSWPLLPDDVSLWVSNSSSGRRWKLDHAPAVGDPTHMVAFGTGRRAFAREA